MANYERIASGHIPSLSFVGRVASQGNQLLLLILKEATTSFVYTSMRTNRVPSEVSQRRNEEQERGKKTNPCAEIKAHDSSLTCPSSGHQGTIGIHGSSVGPVLHGCPNRSRRLKYRTLFEVFDQMG